MNSKAFVDALSKIELQNVFNPYAHFCNTYDLENAPSVRRNNLIHYLAALERIEVDTIWMGRDLGYKGGRRTGLALTDEFHLSHLNSAYPGAIATRATKGPAVSERTATEIWAFITKLPRPPLLWNVFPFHPHEANVELSNRKFSKAELDTVTDLNHQLITWLKIKRVICIGQDAALYAEKLGIVVDCVRHPSYGGVKEFRAGIRKIYEKELLNIDPQSQLFNNLM